MDIIISSAVNSYLELIVVILLISLVSLKNDFFCKTPGLDIGISFLTWIPWMVSYSRLGGNGLIGCVIAQVLAIYTFSIVHEKTHKYEGPTIRVTLDKVIGPAKNHIGLIVSLLAIPLFLTLRLSQIIIWPLLVLTLGFPKYKTEEWINVSRQKFNGLVGHDLIWCLYCDWMTGIYSLGAEMLRNVESFWCPIRFDSDKKCDNCKIDFPDIEEWVEKDKTMKDVTELLVEKYPLNSKEDRSWFSHEDRK